jgi:hypothetical protein
VFRRILVAAVIAVFFVIAHAYAEPGYAHPTWTISKMSKSPVIDGVINADEYADASMITGMVTYQAGGHSLVAQMQDVSWWVGYDDKYLYISMRSPQRPGTWPRAQAKTHDSGDILWDDHVEIQIATKGRENAAKEGYGFYKIIANARGNYRDEFIHNGTPGSETLWSTAGTCKASVHKDHWDLEMSIALAAMDTKSLDHKSWTIQLVRADHSIGAYYAGWIGGGWMDWSSFGEAVFEPDAPVFRFVNRGKVREGDLGLDFEVIGRTHPTPVDLLVRLRDDKGNMLSETTKKVEVKPGERVPISISEKVKLPPDVWNSLYISATAPSVDPSTGASVKKVLYENDIPVTALTPKVVQDYIKPWMDRQPEEGKFRWDFNYWPSYHVATSAIDVDFFGMPEAIKNAREFQVSIFDEKKPGKAIATKRAALADGGASMTMTSVPVGVGNYVARMTLFGADGKTVVGKEEQKFIRKHYAWEGNNIGTKDIVISPYTPLQAESGKGILRSVLREYQLGQDGLFAQIKAGGDGGSENILSAPIRLEGQNSSGTIVADKTAFKITSAKDARIKVDSSCQLGGTAVTMKNDMEIDGWYDVKMTVAPKPGASLDRMTLVIPLWSGADTMYIHRYTDGMDAGKDAIPAGEGVVWDSGKLLPMADNREKWGSFVPIVYAGSGDKGVWWLAEENRDWTMSDKLPAVQYVRTKDGVELRVNIFAAPTKLDRERKIHFALLVDPVKPASDERKWSWAWDDDHKYAGWVTGWRRWGRSTDGYWMEDSDIKALDEFIRGKDVRPDVKRIYPPQHQVFQYGMDKGEPIVLYGSNSNMSEDLPEFYTYAGEWGNPIPSDKTVPEDQQGYNEGGSYKPTREVEYGETGVNWAQSQVDCFIWYHDKLLRGTPVNGTWWDNGSNFLINDYDPIKKEFYQKWSIFTRREVTKRLSTLQTEAGKKPFWINNMGADWSWNQLCWHVENGFYVTSLTASILDTMSVAQFRSLFRVRRGIIHRIDDRVEMGGITNYYRRIRSRAQLGMCLLHDIGGAGDSDLDQRRILGLLDDKVGFFGERDTCPFFGYWRTADMVKIDTPKVYCSVYKGKDRAVLVVMNESPDPADVKFTVNDALLGRKVKKLYDLETGAAFGNLYDNAQRKYLPGEYIPGTFGIEGHGLRLIVVE